MKVKELIEKLQGFDPDMMVVRQGYEGGLTEINHADIKHVALNYHAEWYYGEHEEMNDYTSYGDYQKADVVEVA